MLKKQKLNLSKEDIELAELIGILHDIGRFEELKITKELNDVMRSQIILKMNWRITDERN